TLVMIALGLLVVAASVYLVYVLEILKFRRLDEMRLRLLRPAASATEIESSVVQDLETGEIDAVAGVEGVRAPVREHPLRAEQGVGERQVDEDRVGAEDEGGGARARSAADRR